MAVAQQFKDKSFRWASVVVAVLFTCGAWWGESVGLGARPRAASFAIAGLVPLMIQLITGYGLDAGWVARFSRSETPKHYWGSLAASAGVAVALGYGAYRILVAPSSGLAT